MAFEKKRGYDQTIADLKTASMVVISQKMTHSMEQGRVRLLHNGKPIVGEQRVTGKVV